MTNMLIDPGLPIENEKEMSLSCPDTYFLTGSNSSTCQNGILTTPDLPACLRSKLNPMFGIPFYVFLASLSGSDVQIAAAEKVCLNFKYSNNHLISPILESLV